MRSQAPRRRKLTVPSYAAPQNFNNGAWRRANKSVRVHMSLFHSYQFVTFGIVRDMVPLTMQYVECERVSTMRSDGYHTTQKKDAFLDG